MKDNMTDLRNLLSDDEWEMLCDCCGLCCLYKIRDEDTDELFFTSVICKYMDRGNAHCRCYSDRFKKMPTCTKISPESLPKIANWLPKNCAYRCLFEGIALPDWHPLFSDPSPEAALLLDKITPICIRPNTCISKRTAEDLIKNSRLAVSDKKLTKLLLNNVIEDIDI